VTDVPHFSYPFRFGPRAVGGELLSNGDLSIGLDGWTLTRCTGELDDTVYGDAAPGLKLTRTVLQPHFGANAPPWPFPLVGGQQYVARARVRTAAGAPMFLYVDYYSDDAGANWIGGFDHKFIGSGGMDAIEVTFTPDPGTKVGDYGAYQEGSTVDPSAAIGDVFWMDDLSLRPATGSAGRAAAVVEQDTLDEIADCVLAVLLCPLGFRVELPTFGFQDPTFTTGPVDAKTPAELWEPRATVLVREHQDVFDELVRRATTTVRVRSEN